MELTFCVRQEEYDEAYSALDNPRTSPHKVWVLPGRKVWKGTPAFTVIDNRAGRDEAAYREDFDTLDGALLYALDVHVTAKDQDSWDYMGALADGLDDEGRVEQQTYGYCRKCGRTSDAGPGRETCPACGEPLSYVRPSGEPLPDIVVKQGKMKEIPLGDTEQRLQKLEAKVDEIYERHGWL